MRSVVMVIQMTSPLPRRPSINKATMTIGMVTCRSESRDVIERFAEEEHIINGMTRPSIESDVVSAKATEFVKCFPNNQLM